MPPPPDRMSTGAVLSDAGVYLWFAVGRRTESVNLSPAQARVVAAQLLAAADQAERAAEDAPGPSAAPWTVGPEI